MKKIWGVLAMAVMVGALLGTSERAVAQTGFNGTITYAMHTENGRSSTMVQTTSGDKMRFMVYDSAKGPSQGGGGMILDGDAKTMTMIMGDQQKYMTVTQDQMKQSAAMMGAAAGSPSTPTGTPWTITNTGRTETVAGVQCNVYHATGTNREGKPSSGDFCVAQGVGLALNDPTYTGMMGMGRVNTPPELSQVTDLLKGGKGILKVTETKDGKSYTMLEATSIDRTSPPSSAFAPPPGYTQMQMPQMPAGMKMPAGMQTPAGGAKPPG